MLQIQNQIQYVGTLITTVVLNYKKYFLYLVKNLIKANHIWQKTVASYLVIRKVVCWKLLVGLKISSETLGSELGAEGHIWSLWAYTVCATGLMTQIFDDLFKALIIGYSFEYWHVYLAHTTEKFWSSKAKMTKLGFFENSGFWDVCTSSHPKKEWCLYLY